MIVYVSAEEVRALNPWEKRSFDRLGGREWRRRQRRINRVADEWVSGWRLSGLPFVLEGAEWERLEAAAQQRARMLNRLQADVYGSQTLLKSSRVPVELVYGDPAFAVEYFGMPMEGQNGLLLAAVDFSRDEAGQWWVLDHAVSQPEGLARVLQSRRLIAQYYPENYAGVQPRPVASFAQKWIESLRERGVALSSGGNAPFVVMLVRGESLQRFEESFLARQMGIPLVRPEDLLVRDYRVWFKTIGGLQPVDVILRWTLSEGLDPVACNPDLGIGGVPGLFTCVREGSLRLFNPPGAGVLENRIWLARSEALIRESLGESALISSVPTYWLGDPDVASEASGDGVKWSIRSADGRQTPEETDGVNGENRRKLVAHPQMNWARVAVEDGERWSRRAFRLRLFVLAGETVEVLPGGWLTTHEGSPLNVASGPSRDVWVTANRSSKGAVAVGGKLEAELEPAQAAPGSALAESMYWLGRYMERADSTARMVSVLAEESLYSVETDGGWLVWDAIGAALGEGVEPLLEKHRENPDALARLLLMSRELEDSVWTAVYFADQSGESAQSALTPEFTHALGQWAHPVLDLSGKHSMNSAQIRATCDGVRDGVSSMVGTADRTLVLDASWRFLHIGMLVERAVQTIHILAKILPKAILRQQKHRADDTDLVYLLRLTASLDAYHKVYRSRAFLDRVVRLLWQHPHVPHSLKFCLKELARHADYLQEAHFRGENRLPSLLARLAEQVDHLSVSSLFPARSLELDWGVPQPLASLESSIHEVKQLSELLETGFESLHHAIEHQYFSHEAAGNLAHWRQNAF